MKNNQQIQESYWPRLASQPLQFFLRIHQGQGLSALHLKRGSTPPSRSGSLKAKQQAAGCTGCMECGNNCHSSLQSVKKETCDYWFRCFASIICDHWPTKVVPNWKMCVWISTRRCHLDWILQNDVRIRFHDAAGNSMIILNQYPCYSQLYRYSPLYLIKYLYISTTKIKYLQV